MESYKVIDAVPKISSGGYSLWSERGIVWSKMEPYKSFFVNSYHEAQSVITCFYQFQKKHPSISKNLRVVRRKEEGTDRYQLFFVPDDGSTKNRGAMKGKTLSPEHRAKISAAHVARRST